MNERIKELLKQAGFTVARGQGLKETVPKDVFIANACVSNELQKLAELIVRECIQQLRYKSAQLVDVDYFPEYKEQLEKHFGIKEN